MDRKAFRADLQPAPGHDGYLLTRKLGCEGRAGPAEARCVRSATGVVDARSPIWVDLGMLAVDGRLIGCAVEMQATDDLSAASAAGAGRAPALLGPAGIGKTGPVPAAVGRAARHSSTATGLSSRLADSEFKILDRVANDLGPASPSITGDTDLHSELPVRTSCRTVVGQFLRDFPGTGINAGTG